MMRLHDINWYFWLQGLGLALNPKLFIYVFMYYLVPAVNSHQIFKPKPKSLTPGLYMRQNDNDNSPWILVSCFLWWLILAMIWTYTYMVPKKAVNLNLVIFVKHTLVDMMLDVIPISSQMIMGMLVCSRPDEIIELCGWNFATRLYIAAAVIVAYCQATGTGKWKCKGASSPRRWQYNLMGHHPITFWTLIRFKPNFCHHFWC